MKRTVLEIGTASIARPGEIESGDMHLARRFRNGALVAVVDGLGHGTEAAEAARIAVEALSERPQDSVITLVRKCHEELRGTRGVVMSLASLNTRDETVAWLCVGNIDSILLRAKHDASSSYESIMQRGGVVGHKLPPLQATLTTVDAGDTLVLSTDGIQTGFARHLSLSFRPQQVADHILTHYRKGTDDALVLVARYRGKRK